MSGCGKKCKKKGLKNKNGYGKMVVWGDFWERINRKYY